MHPQLKQLNPYPFERVKALLAGLTPPAESREIKLGMGEPQHATPQLIIDALQSAHGQLASYPATAGQPALRQAIANWILRRYAVTVDPDRELLPVNGSREALFSFAQAVLNRHDKPLVVAPNPFYQIYEGACLLAGGEMRALPTLPADNYRLDWHMLSDSDWQRVGLVYLCSPANPTGKVMTLDEWSELFTLADRYGVTLASDECYSEIYPDEAAPPLGMLQAAKTLGRSFDRLMMFSSLSKRSNVPGLRSGFVAGDADLIDIFLRYRTYHGSAMGGAVQAASIAAWNDEAHVIDNRRLYRQKFAAVLPLLQSVCTVSAPDASFYLWPALPCSDEALAQAVFAKHHVSVLPGRYLGREVNGLNPGAGHIRIALVAPLADCVAGAKAIVEVLQCGDLDAV